MGEVKRVVSNLVQMLDRGSKEAKNLVDTMHALQGYLEEEPKRIIQVSLDRLLSTVRMEAAKRTSGSVVVFVSPEGRVSVGETYGDENSDPYLRRLKSQDFHILPLPGFSYFIHSLKSEVAEGNLIPAIEVLRANAEFQRAPPYSSSARKAEVPREPSPSSEWKLSDFLPAGPPFPPLPRGLFKH